MRIDNAFDADRNAVQRTAAASLIECTRPLQHEIRIQILPRVHLRVARRRMIEARARDRLGSGPAACNCLDDLNRGQLVQRLH